MKIIPYGRQDITDADIQAVTEVLKSDFLTQGPKVEEFENAFASYIGAKYAVAVNNGTSALHLSALSLDVTKGDKWLTSPITFAASGNCILYCGGSVDFVDIDPLTLTMDLNQLEDKVKAGGYSGVVPVDFAGYPVHLEDVKFIAEKYGLKIIEDACHAPGAAFTGKDGNKYFSGDGSFADTAIFSFHPVKHIACGEGGMVTTNDQKLAAKMRQLRTHGITKDPNFLGKNDGGWYMEMQMLGYNFRMPDMLCALGTSQLRRAADGLKRRREIADFYFNNLQDLPLNMIHVPEHVDHAYHLFVIQTEKRNELYEYLKSQGIFAQVHYVPLHTMPYYQGLGFKPGDFPNSEKYYSQGLSIPMYPSITEEELRYVVDKIRTFLA